MGTMLSNWVLEIYFGDYRAEWVIEFDIVSAAYVDKILNRFTEKYHEISSVFVNNKGELVHQ